MQTSTNLSDTETQRPAWLREVDLALPVNPQVVLTGNIRDRHRVLDGDTVRFASTPQLLRDCLIENRYDLVYVYDPVDGIQLLHESAPDVGAKFFPAEQLGRATSATVSKLADLIKQSVSQTEFGVAIVVDYASRLWGEEQFAGPELRSLFSASEKLANNATPSFRSTVRQAPLYNGVFWIVDREADMPSWVLDSEPVRFVTIPMPTLSVRRHVATDLLGSLAGADDRTSMDAAAEHFAELTQGMSVRSMANVIQLAIDGDIAIDRIEDAVRSFRAGVLDNPWQDPLLLERIARGEELIGKRVLGQPQAIRRSLDILLRSAMGLTGAQSGGHAGRPQGILFLAGPTGVGKTELAKSLAEVLFGTEDAYTRFDMSEFSAEHSEARLIGAPPGYIGHGAGGELTNAVRQKPFSILLFDEVEKAHPRILDKFLQILEDGRLTDGSGVTVYFSETVIVFTSNLGSTAGMTSGAATENDAVEYEVTESLIRTAIEQHFTYELGRPELLNRIGDNIIVFDYISPTVGRALVEKYLAAVLREVSVKHHLHISVSDGVRSTIEDIALARIEFGGRGIGSAIETAFVNPLARELFRMPVAAGSATITDLIMGPTGWSMTIESDA